MSRSMTRGQCHGHGSGKPKVNVRFKDNVNVKDIVKVMEISRSYLEQVRAEHGQDQDQWQSHGCLGYGGRVRIRIMFRVRKSTKSG